MITALKNKERLILLLILMGSIVGTNLYLASKTLRRTKNLHELYERIIYSTASYYNPGNQPKNVFDGDIHTAWRESLPVEIMSSPSSFKIPEDFRDPTPDPQTLYLTMEVGLTHFPGIPPQKNPLKKLTIYSGDQSNVSSFKEYARPKRIHLTFFKQDLIDMDREYILPAEPVFWEKKSLTLTDSPDKQEISLDFLPKLEESPKFHINIHQVWLRIVIENFYPGTKYPSQVAISEIDFIKTFPENDKLLEKE